MNPQTSPSPLPTQAALAEKPVAAVVDRRTNNFDFIRFILATMVLASHAPVLITGLAASDPLFRITPDGISMGFLAVNCFFLISGFLIYQSWCFSRSLANYLLKRVLRIYPAFIAASLFSILVAGGIGALRERKPGDVQHGRLPLAKQWTGARDYYSKMDAAFVGQEAVKLVALLPPDSPSTFRSLTFRMVNGSLWTVHYEFCCYLSVAALGLLGVYRWRHSVLVLALIGYAAYVLQSNGWLTLSTEEYPIIGQIDRWPRLGTYFLVGMCYYTYRDKFRPNGWLAILSLACLSVGCAFRGVSAVVLPVFGAYLLFYLSFSEGGSLRKFGKHGDFSYGVFCFGWPVQCVLLSRFQMTNPWLFFLASFLVTLIFAVTSWNYIEKPFLKLKRGKSAPETADAAPPSVAW
jgi:peptidoglycan/LPS O-acetylase OafA/YrhL